MDAIIMVHEHTHSINTCTAMLCSVYGNINQYHCSHQAMGALSHLHHYGTLWQCFQQIISPHTIVYNGAVSVLTSVRHTRIKA